MDEFVVIVPSRGRPQAAAELNEAFRETSTSSSTALIYALDGDDPTRGDYPENAFICQQSGNMVTALNAAANIVLNGDPFAIGFMGDDHRPRTVGWDQRYLGELRSMGTGIVYGNDLLQGETIPTQCAMTANIPKTLGFMAPPGLRHMYVDNFWRDLGHAINGLKYLDDVVVEHMHPIANKAPWDEGHKRVNDAEVYTADSAAYHTWKATYFISCVEKVLNNG